MIPVKEFAQSNALKTKLNAVKSKPPLDAYKMTSAFTKDLTIILSFVMVFAQ